MNFGLGGLGATGSGLSLIRILGSLSKTVGIVRQFAPIYRDMKPILEKAPAFFQRLNSIRNTTYTMSNFNNNLLETNVQETYSQTQENAAGPNFFQ